MIDAAQNYFQCWTSSYPTEFWHDSAEPAEIRRAASWGATGVTTNPVLVPRAVANGAARWQTEVAAMGGHSVDEILWAVTRGVVAEAAAIMQPVYWRTQGRTGRVCAQVNPLRHDDAQTMIAQGVEIFQWAPNLLIKIPVTAAGLVAIEELAARGVSTTATVSFTVPQVVQVAEAFRRGLTRAATNGVDTSQLHSYAVIMIGRLDSHLRDVVQAQGIDVNEAALRVAGMAVAKKATALFAQRGYESVLCFSSPRDYHDPGMVIGGPQTFTIPTSLEDQILAEGLPLVSTWQEPVDEALLAELEHAVPDFVRAYDEHGMTAAEFADYGAVVKTLNEFINGYQGLQAWIQARRSR